MVRVYVSDAKYIQTGILILLFCAFLMIIFINYFQHQLENTASYDADLCVINYIIKNYINLSCPTPTYMYQVTMPCLMVLADSTHYKNITFYRNIQEKHLIESLNDPNKIYCSFVPSNCASADEKYLEVLLDKSQNTLFPPIGLRFQCYVNNNSKDGLLFISSRVTYVLAVSIVGFGILWGIILILYGLQIIQPKYAHERKMDFLYYLKSLKRKINESKRKNQEKKRYKLLEKMLNFIDIDKRFQNELDKELLENLYDDDDLQSKSKSYMRKMRTSMYSDTSIDSYDAISNNPYYFRRDYISSLLADGRIEYNPRARNSSNTSNYNISGKSSVRNVPYLLKTQGLKPQRPSVIVSETIDDSVERSIAQFYLEDNIEEVV